VIRAVLGVLMIFALLFMADQEFADGRYTRVVQKGLIKVRTTVGISMRTSQHHRSARSRSSVLKIEAGEFLAVA